MALVVDLTTGTVLTAEQCVILDEDVIKTLTPEELEVIHSDCDGDIIDLARDKGISVMANHQLLCEIIETIWSDGPDTQWDSDTVVKIVECVLGHPELC